MILNFIDYLKENRTITIIGFIVLLIVLGFVVVALSKFTKRVKGKRDMITRMVTVAIFATLSIILYLPFMRFPLPFLPSFLEINFSNLPILIGAFLLGPVEGILIIIIKVIILLPFTTTFCVGDVADLIISVSIVLVSSLIYRKHKSKKGAIIALGSTAITWVLVGILANYLILVPAYITLFFGGNESAFISCLSMIPGVNESNYLVKYTLFGVIPFNLIISITVSLITFFVYKKLSVLFHKFDDEIE